MIAAHAHDRKLVGMTGNLADTGDVMNDTVTKIDQITTDLEDEIKRVIPSNRTKIEEVDVGRLTGEALTMAYEAAAKQIEEMGRHLVEEIKSCEQSALDVVKELDKFKAATSQAIEHCEQTATKYREEAGHLSSHVKDRCAAADDVRKMCEEMIAKIRIPERRGE